MWYELRHALVRALFIDAIEQGRPKDCIHLALPCYSYMKQLFTVVRHMLSGELRTAHAGIGLPKV